MAKMIDTFVMMGFIQNLIENTPRAVKNPQSTDAKKGVPTAIIHLMFGDQREATGRSTEFVSAVPIRVPHFRYEKLRGKLRKGQLVQVTGHHQGVLRMEFDKHSFNVELVADKIEPVSVFKLPANLRKQFDAVDATPAADSLGIGKASESPEAAPPAAA